jgi:bifunctional non-homologous end joining protein LigD
VRLYQAAAELRIEGIVAKRSDSPYRRGRTSDWVKIRTLAGKEICRAGKVEQGVARG